MSLKVLPHGSFQITQSETHNSRVSKVLHDSLFKGLPCEFQSDKDSHIAIHRSIRERGVAHRTSVEVFLAAVTAWATPPSPPFPLYTLYDVVGRSLTSTTPPNIST